MKPRKHKTFAEISAQFIGKPFKHGGNGPDAYDCIGFVYAFLKARGKAGNIKVEYGEWNLDNYSCLDQGTDHEIVHNMLFDIFDQNGVEIPVNKKVAGDAVIVRDRSGDYYPGIYAGNGIFITAFRDWGVRAVNIDKKALEIVKVRRPT